MAHTWGPIERPVEHDVKGIAADEEGQITKPRPNNRDATAGRHDESYDATDGRHNRADHQGWHSVDGDSGCDAEDGFIARGRFEDGPGVWRQT
jgi:hypothetical protein